MQGTSGPNEHETVGAYALGILDDAEATAFEAHLANCEWCAQQLDELSGMEPMLAALANLPGSGTPAIGESLSARPGPRVVEGLLDEVSARRAHKRRRSLYMIAAAVALIVGGPLTVIAASGGDDSGGTGTTALAPAKAAFQAMSDKSTATDPTTHATATVAIEKKDWGTNAVLQLKNVTGPEECSLIAVGKNGERETLTSWSVPKWGYGLPGAKTEEAKQPLYVRGGAAFSPNEIDHFEVMTFSGERVVEVDV